MRTTHAAVNSWLVLELHVARCRHTPGGDLAAPRIIISNSCQGDSIFFSSSLFLSVFSFFPVLGHAQQCSGATSSSVLGRMGGGGHFWQCSGDHAGLDTKLGSPVCKACAQPVELFPATPPSPPQPCQNFLFASQHRSDPKDLFPNSLLSCQEVHPLSAVHSSPRWHLTPQRSSRLSYSCVLFINGPPVLRPGCTSIFPRKQQLPLGLWKVPHST